MTSPTFVLLTGPAGAGKSSAAAAWATQGTAPKALLNVDELRTLRKAGFAHPEHGWNVETERQWHIAFDLCVAMVRVYKANGVSAIIDVYAPPAPEDPWAELVAELGATRITLLPSLDVCLTRNAERAREPFLQDADLRQNYEGFAECVALRRRTPAGQQHAHRPAGRRVHQCCRRAVLRKCRSTPETQVAGPERPLSVTFPADFAPAARRRASHT